MLRIISGEWGSRKIAVPPGQGTRPTSERAREALFSSLALQGGETVLDLFSGSGALGLESVSRGAEAAVLVESSSPAARCIRSNIDLLGAVSRTRVIEADWQVACRNLQQDGSRFDVIFVDPPWADCQEVGSALAAVIEPILADDGVVVCESPAGQPMEVGLPLQRERRYGDTLLRFHGTK
jgi:16S rRNA (guanine(966)-N(2))-methyltransferase RsmD